MHLMMSYWYKLLSHWLSITGENLRVRSSGMSPLTVVHQSLNITLSQLIVQQKHPLHPPFLQFRPVMQICSCLGR